MTLDQVLQLGVSVGTIAVAILAIWGERIRHLLGLGPKLVLELHDPQGEPIDVSTEPGKPIPSRYFHLRVSNKNRWSQATNVRIVVTGLTRPAADGQPVSQPLSGPLQLEWRYANLHPQYSVVGPDDICDLGHLYRGDKFRLSPYVFPSNFAGTLDRNQRLGVEVKAVADNAESKPICIDISWDGEWSDDTLDMAGHLVVKEVNCSPAS
jgi:hypothetical protein